ncbi:MAG: AIR synthase-related protein, partial [candidate division NC10 bacterium]
GLRRDAVLFGESQSRVVVSTQASNQERVLSLAKESGVAAEVIGTVGGDRLVVEVEADRLGPGCRIDTELDLVYDRWANGLERALGQVDNP